MSKMNRSKSSIESYQDQVSRILGRSKLSQNKPNKQVQKKQRLTFSDIQNITRSMINDKKVHSHNMGVITNIKGKMYCLKLGQVSKPKDFSYFFYSTQYKKKTQNANKPIKIL